MPYRHLEPLAGTSGGTETYSGFCGARVPEGRISLVSLGTASNESWPDSLTGRGPEEFRVQVC